MNESLANSQNSDEFSNFELFIPLRFLFMNLIDFSLLNLKQLLLLPYQESKFKLKKICHNR